MANQADAVLPLCRTLRVVVAIHAAPEHADVGGAASDLLTVGVDVAAHTGVERIALRFVALEHAVRAHVA